MLCLFELIIQENSRKCSCRILQRITMTTSVDGNPNRLTLDQPENDHVCPHRMNNSSFPIYDNVSIYTAVVVIFAGKRKQVHAIYRDCENTSVCIKRMPFVKMGGSVLYGMTGTKSRLRKAENATFSLS